MTKIRKAGKQENRKAAHLIPLLMIAALAALLLTALPGCTAEQVAKLKSGLQQAQARSAHADKLITDGQNQIDKLKGQIDALPADSPDRASLQKQYNALAAGITKTKAIKADADASIADFQARLDKLENAGPLQIVGAAAQSIAGVLPPPWSTYAALAGLLIGGIGMGVRDAKKHQQTKDAAASVVSAIESAKNANSGTVNFGDAATKTALKASMTDAARALVKQAQQQSNKT